MLINCHHFSLCGTSKVNYINKQKILSNNLKEMTQKQYSYKFNNIKLPVLQLALQVEVQVYPDPVFFHAMVNLSEILNDISFQMIYEVICTFQEIGILIYSVFQEIQIWNAFYVWIEILSDAFCFQEEIHFQTRIQIANDLFLVNGA